MYNYCIIKNMEELIDKGNTLIDWHFPEFEKPERSLLWYVIMLITSIAFIVIAIMNSNFLFAVIIVMTIVILILQERRDPLELNIKIMEAGIEIGEKFYKYKDISSFFIIYEPPITSNLYIQMKTRIAPRLNIPLKEQNPIKVRDILMNFLSEDVEKDDEPLSDYLSKILKI